ncbi:hypothetical protein GP486_001116 [Trichoglossum hirsutum]|uniref:Arf-GAP domain-containing protein n=1 Tax=Trichoglossum hirsutum TaxID=265104 RepID=A0A9P8LH99_9PEZI|nr:hypothetical protein GP486_001116 [Trichoglossum hirsutum]
MGTHVSRVKSVDLDAWTDEQLQSVLQWGNTRANKSVSSPIALLGTELLTFPRYWEAKLAPGHVPSEGKIENFIRTKYESKRWVMDGGIPDPATLDDEGDDDIPLNLVQEKQKLERSSSTRTPSSSQPRKAGAQSEDIDLFGDSTQPIPRPATTTPSITHPPPPKAAPAPPKQTKPGDSLLGLDFFGPPTTQGAPPGRPSSAAPNPQGSAVPSRPDLKQSILSLYASNPRQQSQSQTPSRALSNSQSPTLPQQQPQQTSLGGLGDSFSGLSFTSSATAASQPQQSKPSPFANLGSFSSPRSTPTQISPSTSGGGFFNATSLKPAPAMKPPPPQATQTISNSSGFFNINSPTGVTPKTTTSPAAPALASGLGDLFDFSSPPAATQSTQKPTISPTNSKSVFNLSAQPLKSASTQQHSSQATTETSASATLSPGWASTDAWGSNDAWATPDTSTKHTTTPPVATLQPNLTSTDFGWSSTGGELEASNTLSHPPAPKTVSADEDFGGWSSASRTDSTPKVSASVGKTSGTGFVGNDDLFSNVWE